MPADQANYCYLTIIGVNVEGMMLYKVQYLFDYTQRSVVDITIQCHLYTYRKHQASHSASTAADQQNLTCAMMANLSWLISTIMAQELILTTLPTIPSLRSMKPS